MTDDRLSECLTLLQAMRHGNDEKWSVVRELYVLVLQAMPDEALALRACQWGVLNLEWRPAPAKLREIAWNLAYNLPTADEAWAMMPRSEQDTVVWTDEMAQALAVAQPLLDEGDQIGARMAFKGAYERLITTLRDEGRAPSWTVSLGWDPDARLSVVEAAVSRMQLPPGTAQKMLAAAEHGPAGITMKEARERGLLKDWPALKGIKA